MSEYLMDNMTGKPVEPKVTINDKRGFCIELEIYLEDLDRQLSSVVAWNKR